jgi:hypothetical protein
MTTKEELLGPQNKSTEIDDVLLKLKSDPLAYFDEKKMVREVPVFRYDADGNPVHISHWAKRAVAPKDMEVGEAQRLGLDVYLERRGWVRGGKKAERDFQEK